jgi:hypothetical protein
MQLPILLGAHFLLPYGDAVGLRIQSNNDIALTITIIHDSMHGLASYELSGCMETDTLTVTDHESLIIVVRDGESHLIASAVFEVNTGLIESVGMVLSPLSLVNLHIDQMERCVMTRATERILDAVFGHEQKAQVR